MPRKESMAVPVGNDPVPQQEDMSLANPRWRTYIKWLKKYSKCGTGKLISFFENIKRNGEVWISV